MARNERSPSQSWDLGKTTIDVDVDAVRGLGPCAPRLGAARRANNRAALRRGAPPRATNNMASMAAVACPLCAATFPSEAQLIEHCGGFLPEPDEEPYYCSCGSTFCSPQSLAGHCETTGHAPEGAEAFEDGAYGDYGGGDGDGAVAVAEDGSCVCPMCGAQFTSKAALVSHCGGEEPRVGEEPHWCSCGRAFCSARALVAHAEALGHEAEEPVYEDDGDGDYEALSRLDDENYKRGLSDAAKAALVERPLDAPLEDPITKDVLPAGAPAVELVCGHAFARDTLMQWFESSRICPVCRLEIEE